MLVWLKVLYNCTGAIMNGPNCNSLELIELASIYTNLKCVGFLGY
jgi:hypothetical protein